MGPSPNRYFNFNFVLLYIISKSNLLNLETCERWTSWRAQYAIPKDVENESFEAELGQKFHSYSQKMLEKNKNIFGDKEIERLKEMLVDEEEKFSIQILKKYEELINALDNEVKDQKELEIILINVQKNKLSPADAIKQLQNMPYENIDFAKIDHHRELRSGLPEVIYGQGKSIPQLKKIIQSLKKANSDTLATKISEDTYKKLKTSLPKDAKYNEQAQTLVIRNKKIKQPTGLITIVTAGTSDIPIAEEAAVTANLLGSRVETIFDVGVAGLHRLLDNIEQIKKARVLIVVAGMEGALASVVGGLVSQPIIAVPTSIGYGASFNGISALLTMLNSCAPGIAVVNIDNGFGAGCMAHRINILAEKVSERG